MSSSEHDSDSCDELDISSSALNSELQKVTELVKQLDNFQPEVKKAKGRPPKKLPTPSKPSVTSILLQVCNLTKKILNKVSVIESASKKISSAHAVDAPSSFAAVVAGKTVPADTAIQNIDDRLDQVEQHRLSPVVRLDGPVVKTLVDEYLKQPVPTRDRAALQEKVVDVINKVKTGTIDQSQVVDINIVGGEKKHVKLTTVSKETQVKLIRVFKKDRPSEFYAGEYLTKSRSDLFFKLRKLKPLNSSIKSTYIYNGSICCKLNNNDKIFTLNTFPSFKRFVEEFKLTE